MSVGGTPGSTPGSTGNRLSFNLGGIDVNYDLGPSVATVADQSNAFLNNSFNTDTAFLGSAINGSQTFLNGIISPVIDMAKTQQQFNTEQLPAMFTDLNAQNFQLGSEALTTEGSVATASIASSNATAQIAAQNSGGGGGCYITTAVCEGLGLPDDCHTLRVLREFRDTYMSATSVRRAFVREYYLHAPALVEKIKARADRKDFLGRLYTDYILPALLAIENGAPDRAFKIYRHAIYFARAAVNAPVGAS